MRLRPTQVCCGALSLLTGVQLICMYNLIASVICVAIASSKETILIHGVSVFPRIQVYSGAWCLVGIPIIIGAGVGAVYRIETHLRVFFWYLSLSFVFGAFIGVYFLVSGALPCTLTGSQRQVSGVVCGFTDALIFFWMMVMGILNMYFMYIVWSAAEEIAHLPFPEMMRYSESLRTVGLPGAREKQAGLPKGTRMASSLSLPNQQLPGPSGSIGTYGGTSFQSFIPAPESQTVSFQNTKMV